MKVDAAMLDAFAVRCAPEDVPARLGARYHGLVDRLSLICHAAPERHHPERWREVVASLHDL